MPSQQMARLPVAVFLAWLIPGAGHLFLGHRARGLIFLVTITLTFWTGVAVGGVRGTVDPQERGLWFLAQVCNGGNALSGLLLHKMVQPPPVAPAVEQAAHRLGRASASARATYAGHWLGLDVAVHYTGVAGLLNLLVIFDVILRAERANLVREETPAPVS